MVAGQQSQDIEMSHSSLLGFVKLLIAFVESNGGGKHMSFLASLLRGSRDRHARSIRAFPKLD